MNTASKSHSPGLPSNKPLIALLVSAYHIRGFEMAKRKVTVSPIAPGVRSKATEPEPRRPRREERVVEAVRLGRKAHEGAGPRNCSKDVASMTLLTPICKN